MAISTELLEILVCPADKEALELKPDLEEAAANLRRAPQ